jgi:hypothetical protein
MPDSPHETTAPPKRRRRLPGAPKRRNCEIYERHVIAGETQEHVAAVFGVSRQRVGQIAARVEGWLATHGDHPLAQQMRLRTNRRWDAIYSRAIEGFDRSREDRQVRKERLAPPTSTGETPNIGETPLPQERPVVTFTEITTHQQKGDPRFLALAMRAAEREDRRWQQVGPRLRQQAEPRLPVGQSRALTKLAQRVADLEAERREPAVEKGTCETYPCSLPPLPPAPPLPQRDPDYVWEGVDDIESRQLKARGDREGWKTRQRELKRDLAHMIRRDWPDIDDFPPDETTAPETEEHATRRGAEGEGTAGNDDDHRLATLARKLGVSAPRPRFVAVSSRATPSDGFADEFQ